MFFDVPKIHYSEKIIKFLKFQNLNYEKSEKIIVNLYCLKIMEFDQNP